MKTYSQFKSEMSPEERLEADALFMSVFSKFQGMPGMDCSSYRPGDVAHFKKVEISEQELAMLEEEKDF